MAFDVEHDWQANLATPRARIGQRVKTRLLVVLCFVWVMAGLLGHQPWKPDESQSISIIKQMVDNKQWLSAYPVGETQLDTTPLYYQVASLSAILFSPILEMHDAARMMNAVWVGLTLLLMGMTGREMWGLGSGRQTNLLFLGSLGLLIPCHVLLPQVAGLMSYAMVFYALALHYRRPYRAAGLLGVGLGLLFLSIGLTGWLSMAIVCLGLLVFNTWRTRRYYLVLALAWAIGLALGGSWLALMALYQPDQLYSWFSLSVQELQGQSWSYYGRTLLWFSWPSLPLALWGGWCFRRQLMQHRHLQLIVVFFTLAFIVLGLHPSPREIYALHLLIPIAALAGGSVETMKRGAAGLLNWFGIMLFGSIAVLITLGWTAMMLGWPHKLSERMHILSGVDVAQWAPMAMVFSLVAFLTWLFVLVNYKHSNRSAITDWAVGITAMWAMLMALWLPWIDNAKRYDHVMLAIKQQTQPHFACMLGKNVGKAQEALLHYYTDIRLLSTTTSEYQACDYLLIQDERGRTKYMPGPEWQPIWQGKRAAERKESFRLFVRH